MSNNAFSLDYLPKKGLILVIISQPTITCSKLTIETQGVKYD